MKLTIDLKFFTYSVIASIVSLSIISGFAQKHIHFAAVENEMGCFFLSSSMAIICLFFHRHESAEFRRVDGHRQRLSAAVGVEEAGHEK